VCGYVHVCVHVCVWVCGYVQVRGMQCASAALYQCSNNPYHINGYYTISLHYLTMVITLSHRHYTITLSHAAITLSHKWLLHTGQSTVQLVYITLRLMG